MKCRFVPVSVALLAIFLLQPISTLFAGQYFQDFTSSAVGAASFSDGSTLSRDNGIAAVQDSTYKELALSASGTLNTRTAYLLPDLDPGVPTYAFSVKWVSQVNGNFPNAADGFSLTYGQVGSLNLISSSYAQESGYPTGISFCVQNYSTPGFYLRVNGSVIASNLFTPATKWGVNSNAKHFFELDWNYTNGVTARVDGQIVLANVPTPGLAIQSGNRFVFAGRCGSLTEEVRVDNIVAVTGGNMVQTSVSTPYYADTSSDVNAYQAAKAFDGNSGTAWQTYATNGFIGATVVPSTGLIAYALTPGDTGSGSGIDPRVWTLEATTNSGSTWNTVASDTGYFLNRYETRAWLVTNSMTAGAYRLKISLNNGNTTRTALADLRMYAFQPVGAFDWAQSDAPGQLWGFHDIACSSDGSKAYCGVGGSYSGYIWRSTNYGANWTQLPNSPLGQWNSISCSTNGSNIVVVSYADGIYVSHDAGANWTLVPNTSQRGVGIWWGVSACSADGTKMYAARADDGSIWHSTDSGTTWTQYSGAPTGEWNSMCYAEFGDGLFLVANNRILSSGYGQANWVPYNIVKEWSAIVATTDGLTPLASAFNDHIYTYQSGGNWVVSGNSPSTTWNGLAIGTNGTVYGTAGGDAIYVSRDNGYTWTKSYNSGQSWVSIACSADGTRGMAAAFGAGVWYRGYIYPTAPNATTGSASSVARTSATLNGQGDPNLATANLSFQYGLTTNYGSYNVSQSVGSGNSAVSGSAVVTGINPGTTYHYRAVCSNAFGVAFGSDATFTTVASNAFFNIALSSDTAVPSSANWDPTTPVTNAIDATAASKYLNYDKLNTGLTIYPSISNVVVQALGLISANDAPERDPSSFAVYGSHDGTTFTLIASNTVPLFASRYAIQVLPFANTNAYAVYKVMFPTVVDPNSANSMQIAEVELLPFADLTSTNDTIDLTLPAGTSLVGQGSTNSMIDRLLGGEPNKFDVQNDTSNVVALITPTAGTSILKGFELIGGNDDATYPGRTASSVTVEGSTDGTNFVTIGTVTPQSPTASMQIQGFEFLDNTNGYSKYRVTFGPPQSGNVLQIGELRLFGQTAPKIITAASNGNLHLTWPVSGFVLQQNTSLGTANWSTAPNAVTVTNGQSQVTIPITGRAFYRLKAQ